MKMKEIDNHIEIVDTSKIKPKKITGTRLASVLNLNRWSTPFQTWCEITKAYCMPFEDTKYTIAGKTIEPLQLDYLKTDYAFNVKTPTDIFGSDYFKQTHGDFFNDDIFGGMWDGLVFSEDGETVERVIECKTTKRAEDWYDNGELKAPEYYKMQACLYAYLKGTPNVTMIVSFLEDFDYDNLESYTVNDENTGVFNFSIDFKQFEHDVIEPAKQWWNEHVLTGVSPTFDEVKDKDYLKALRTTTAAQSDEIDDLLEELEECTKIVNSYLEKCKKEDKRASELKKKIKAYAEENIGDSDFWEYNGRHATCKLSTSYREQIQTDNLKADGLYEKYVFMTPSRRFTVSFSK